MVIGGNDSYVSGILFNCGDSGASIDYIPAGQRSRNDFDGLVHSKVVKEDPTVTYNTVLNRNKKYHYIISKYVAHI